VQNGEKKRAWLSEKAIMKGADPRERKTSVLVKVGPGRLNLAGRMREHQGVKTKRGSI